MTMLWGRTITGCFQIPNIGKGVKQMLKFIVPLQLRLMELRDREEGQAFAEYAVLVAVVAIGLIVGMGLFAGQIKAEFTKIGNLLP